MMTKVKKAETPKADDKPKPTKTYVLPSSVEAMKLIKQLSDLVPVIQQEVHATYGTGHMNVARAYIVTRLLVGTTQVALKPLGDTLEELKLSKLPEEFEAEGVNPPSANVDGAYRITLSSTLRASIRKGMKQKAIEWLKSHKLGDIVTTTVNASTLSATARVMAEENRELDQDLFNVGYIPGVSLNGLQGQKVPGVKMAKSYSDGYEEGGEDE
jgi:hypothetical protein